MKRSLLLWIYRLLWMPALYATKAAAGLENIFGGKVFPARWQLSKRLGWRWREPPSGNVIWLHAASLGECKGSFVLALALAQTLNDLSVSFVLTANTLEGLEFLTHQIQPLKDSGKYHASLAPLDHPRIVRKFLTRFHIQALLLFEVEIWPHFILTTRKKNLPVYWVSARLTSKAQRNYRMFPRMAQSLLHALNWIQTQGEDETKTLRDWKCNHVSTGADLRGLFYLHPADSNGDLQNWTRPFTDRLGVAFLSMHKEEIPFVISAIKDSSREFRLRVFPRMMEELHDFQNTLRPLGFELYSQNPNGTLLIVDEFGLIPKFLEGCHAAVIGGSFAAFGGHNLWEPLATGVAMVIGPQHSNQEYLVRKLQRVGLLHITNETLNAEILRKSETDPGPACREFAAAESYILQQAVKEIGKQLRADLTL